MERVHHTEECQHGSGKVYQNDKPPTRKPVGRGEFVDKKEQNDQNGILKNRLYGIERQHFSKAMAAVGAPHKVRIGQEYDKAEEEEQRH